MDMKIYRYYMGQCSEILIRKYQGIGLYTYIIHFLLSIMIYAEATTINDSHNLGMHLKFLKY